MPWPARCSRLTGSGSRLRSSRRSNTSPRSTTPSTTRRSDSVSRPGIHRG
jgi:hypothetical protein